MRCRTPLAFSMCFPARVLWLFVISYVHFSAAQISATLTTLNTDNSLVLLLLVCPCYSRPPFLFPHVPTMTHTHTYTHTYRHTFIHALFRRPHQFYLPFQHGINTDSGSKSPLVSFTGIEAFAVDKILLHPVMSNLRVYKTEEELKVLRYVAEVSSRAHTQVIE